MLQEILFLIMVGKPNFSTNQKTLFNILSKQKELVLKD